MRRISDVHYLEYWFVRTIEPYDIFTIPKDDAVLCAIRMLAFTYWVEFDNVPTEVSATRNATRQAEKSGYATTMAFDNGIGPRALSVLGEDGQVSLMVMPSFRLQLHVYRYVRPETLNIHRF